MAKKKKKTRPPKFDYLSDEFLLEIETMAAKGYTDKDIALGLVVKFGDAITPQYFKDLKNGKDENGDETEVSVEISAALTRGRATINLAVRSTYLKIALGGLKTKSITKRKIINSEGEVIDSDVMQETEIELPPNLNALSTWLFNHDQEWREKTIEGKRLDVTTNGKDINTPVFRVLTKKEIEEFPDAFDKEY